MKRWLAIIAITLALATIAGLALRHFDQRRRSYYTDGARIEQPLHDAFLREVLWQPPHPLTAAINSGLDDSAPCAVNEAMVIFARGGPMVSGDLYARASMQDDDGAQSSAPLIDVNSDYDDTDPAVSSDGRTLIFASDRPGGFGGYDLWLSRRGDFGWTLPINLGPEINSPFDERGPALSTDGARIAFSSNRRGIELNATQPADSKRDERGDHDLYAAVIRPDGFEGAQPLTLLNSPADDRAPAFSPANDFLYFCSDRAGGIGGFDLYRSRLLDDRELAPEALGGEINSPADEIDPAPVMGGFGLLFASTRSMDHASPSVRDANIWRSESREVFVRIAPRSPLDFASIWAWLAPLLLWLLLLLTGLALLATLWKGVRSRRLSLIVRCLLASVIAHVLLLVLLTFWQVTTQIASLMDRDGTRVLLTTANPNSELAEQLQGGMTDASLSALSTEAAARVALEAPTLVSDPQQARLQAEHAPSIKDEPTAMRVSMADASPEAPQAPEARPVEVAENTAATHSVIAPPVAAAEAPTESAIVARGEPAQHIDRSERSHQPDARAVAAAKLALEPSIPEPIAALALPAHARDVERAAHNREVAPQPARTQVDPLVTAAVDLAQPAPPQGTRSDESSSPTPTPRTDITIPRVAAQAPPQAPGAVPIDLATDVSRIAVERADSAQTALGPREATAMEPLDPRIPPSKGPMLGVFQGATTDIDAPTDGVSQLVSESEALAQAPLASPASELRAEVLPSSTAAAHAAHSSAPAHAAPFETVADSKQPIVPDSAIIATDMQPGATVHVPNDGAPIGRLALALPVELSAVGDVIAASQPADAVPRSVLATSSRAREVAMKPAPTQPASVAHAATGSVAAADLPLGAPNPGLTVPEAMPSTVAPRVAASGAVTSVRPAGLRAPLQVPATGEDESALDARDAGHQPTLRSALASTASRHDRQTTVAADSQILTARPDERAPLSLSNALPAGHLGARDARPAAQSLKDEIDTSETLARSAPDTPAIVAAVAVPEVRESVPAGVEFPEAPKPVAASAATSRQERRNVLAGKEAPSLAELSPPAVRSAPATDLAESRVAAAAGPAHTSDAGLPPTTIVALSPGMLEAPAGTPEPDVSLRLPTDMAAVHNPYVARREDTRLETVKKMGGSEATERAVAMALEWLARHQSPDGRWATRSFDDDCGECGGEGKFDTDIATTGLALLCFLGADHTHLKSGKYQAVVDRGIRWLMERQADDGDLRGGETMYSHGIAAIALGEAYGMTADPRLRDRVERAVDFIDQARNRTVGGWRYEPRQAGDTSVTGWQVMAMMSAKRAGLVARDQAFAAASTWMTQVSLPNRPGQYAYQPGQPPTPSMTAEGMFVQQLLGLPRDDPRMRGSVDMIIENLPLWDVDPNTYYWYYATLAMFQYQGEPWRIWNERLTSVLLKNQRTSGPQAGSWPTEDNWSKVGGRVYQTALCTLCLEVYYRYLPMYQTPGVTDTRSAVRGVVTNARTGEPLVNAMVRIDMETAARALVAVTDRQGRYALALPELPAAFVAVSASIDEYTPQTTNIAADEARRGQVIRDFALHPENANVIVLESAPQVHHLGNNEFEGRINSQFQTRADGLEYFAQFVLQPHHLPPHANRAELVLMAKGAQALNPILINGEPLGTQLNGSPRDGSFGEFRVAIPVALLREGVNTISIRSSNSEGDLDDFEFINVQVHVE